MVEAFAGPMWGQVSGGGPSCDFNASFGSGVVARMGREKAIRGQAFDLATAKGELFDVDPIGLYTMRAAQAQFFDKSAGVIRDELTLVSDDFNGESIGVWTDAGEYGTGTSQEYTHLVTWAHELATTEGEATLTFMSPGEKRADGKPEHRLFIWKKENNGEVKGTMYSLTGSARTIDSFAQSLGFSKTSGSLDGQRLFQKEVSYFNHTDIFDAYSSVLSPKEKQEQAGYLERFRKEAQEVSDDMRWAKIRHRQEVYEHQLVEHEGDIQEALGLVVQGFAALPEVLEREKSQYQDTPPPVDAVYPSYADPDSIGSKLRGVDTETNRSFFSIIQPQKEVIPSFSFLEIIHLQGLDEEVYEQERDERKRDAIKRQTENEMIPIQDRSKHSDEEVLGRKEKITSGLALSAFALLKAVSNGENTHPSAVEIIQVEEIFPLTQEEDHYHDIIHFLFTPDEEEDEIPRDNPFVFVKTPMLADIFRELSLLPPVGSESVQDGKGELHWMPPEVPKGIITAGEKLLQFLQEEKFDTPKKEEAIGTMNAADEDQTEILQKLLALVQQETLPKEVRYITLVLLYKEMQKITMERGKEMPLVLLEKLKHMFVHSESIEHVAENVEEKLKDFMGKAGEISKEILEITPRDIFLGLIEGSEIIEHAPLLLDMEEKKKQIRKFIILSKLLYVINASGNGEKPLYFNKKLFYKSPFYLDVSIITLLNVLDIPKEIQQRLLLSLGIEIERLKEQLHQRKEEYDSIPYERGTISFEEVQWIPLQYAFHGPKNKRHAPKKSSSGYTVFPSFMILFDYSRDVHPYLLQWSQ